MIAYPNFHFPGLFVVVRFVSSFFIFFFLHVSDFKIGNFPATTNSRNV